MVIAAIFDMDGTLTNFRFDIRQARKALIEELARRGYDASGVDVAAPTQGILDAAIAQTTPGDGERYQEFRRAAFAILDGFEMESLGTASAFPRTRETLDYLKSKDVRIAVLTNSGRRAASEALRKAGLFDCFEFVLTRDETVLMKPRPEGMAMAVSKFGFPPGSVYYVGDSLLDIAAARGAGVRMIGVATGNYPAERLKSAGADFAVTSISELPGVLGV